MKNTNCLNCGHEFELTEVYNDSLGWHTVCPECDSSFDINIEEFLVPRGTKVILDDGTIGIIDGNDEEITEEFEDINYYFCPIEFTHLKVWSNHYKYICRDEFEILEEDGE